MADGGHDGHFQGLSIFLHDQGLCVRPVGFLCTGVVLFVLVQHHLHNMERAQHRGLGSLALSEGNVPSSHAEQGFGTRSHPGSS